MPARLGATALALLLVGAQSLLEAKLVALAPAPGVSREASAPFPPRLLRWLSLGQLPVVVDSLWLRALQATDVETARRAASDERSQLFREMDALTELDQAYFEAFEHGTILLSVVSRDPTGAAMLVEKGLRFLKLELDGYPESFRQGSWARAWNLYVLKAYLHMFELGDMPEAASAFVEASRLPGSPAYLDGYERRLSKPDGQYEVGLRLLNSLIQAAKDVPSRERLEEQRRSLHVGQYLFNLNRDFRVFLNKIPEYRNEPEVPRGGIERLWERFRDEGRVPESLADPWGGKLSVDPGKGRIVSTTPHEKVLGLD
jgi:hypothetical protein